MSLDRLSFLRGGAGKVMLQDANGNGVLTAGVNLDYDEDTGQLLLWEPACRSCTAVDVPLRIVERYPTAEEDAEHLRAIGAPEAAERMYLQLLDGDGGVELRRHYIGMSIAQIGRGRIAIYDATGTVRALVAPPFRIEVKAPGAEEAIDRP